MPTARKLLLPVILVLLTVQFILGMLANLYSTIPLKEGWRVFDTQIDIYSLLLAMSFLGAYFRLLMKRAADGHA